MKLLYDGQIFWFQRAGGINRYFAEVISRLPSDWEPTIFGASSLGVHAPVHANLNAYNGPHFRPRRFSQKIRTFRCERLLRHASLLHPTYYDMSEGLHFGKATCPIVITVYDMIHANFPDLMERADDVIRSQREAVIRADHVVCISKATETGLLNHVPSAAGKTSVIYLGSSFDGGRPTELVSPDGPPSFLYVGTREKYKNFPFLLNAFAAALQSNKRIRLRIAGPPLADHERWQLRLLGIDSSVDVHVFPDEKTLEGLYRSSTALLYPSRHEGFGMPPLEAMSCGTVAVTANTTSLPEVVGDGGVMLDPTKAEQWTDCIVELARGGIDRAKIIARGLEQSKRFSWDTTAAQHVRLYQALGRNGN